MLDESFWIEFVQDQISIALLTGSEDNDLEMFGHFFQETQSVGTDWHIAEFSFLDLNFDIVFTGGLMIAMYQCLIHVNHQHFFALILRVKRKIERNIGFR